MPLIRAFRSAASTYKVLSAGRDHSYHTKPVNVEVIRVYSPPSQVARLPYWSKGTVCVNTIETAHQLSSQTPRHSEPLALDDSDMAQVPEKVLSWLYSVLHVRQNPPT